MSALHRSWLADQAAAHAQAPNIRPRLSPAQRNVLFAVCHGGLSSRGALPHNTRQSLDALRERGLLDDSYQPTAAGRAVFPRADGGERRPGIGRVMARVAAQHPDWPTNRVAAVAKHLYTEEQAR